MERLRFAAFLSSNRFFLLFIICALLPPLACSRQSRDQKLVGPQRAQQPSGPEQQGLRMSEAAVFSNGKLFYNTLDAQTVAVDAETAKESWQFKTGSGIVGQPVPYGGKQYVAILSGVRGRPGAVVAGGLDRRDGPAALGFASAMTDLTEAMTREGRLYVFSLA